MKFFPVGPVGLTLAGVIMALSAPRIVVAQSEYLHPSPSASARAIEDAKKATPQIIVGTTSAAPGETATVPITFKPGQGTGIKNLKLTVVFRSAILKFDKLELASSADAKKVEVTLEDHVTSGEGRDESSMVIIKAVIPPEAADQGGLPSGVLGNMFFRVDPDSAGAIVNLEASIEATESGSVSPLPTHQVRVTHGAVFVIAPGGPANGCFFFTH